MRTLHTALRVSDPAASLAFYEAVGFEVVGRVTQTSLGDLTLLKLPDDEFATLELVHRPADAVDVGSGFSHLVVQTPSLTSTLAALAEAGFMCGDPESPGGPSGPLVSWTSDPDGYRIELTQWPFGHPAGMTAADFGG